MSIHFIVLKDADGGEVWINVFEIAAISETDTTGIEIHLKSGKSFEVVSAAEAIYEALKFHTDGDCAYSRL